MISAENEKRIDEWVMAHEEEYLEDLRKLVNIDSPASMGVTPGEYPFGKGSAAALAKAKEMAEGYGFSVENRDNFCLVADMGEGDEKVGVFGHLDIVPVGTGWNYPPLDITREGDMIIGRGVMDDKGPLWSSVYAIRCLKELGLLPKRQIEVFMGGDEECGMCDIEHYKETTAKMPVISFTPDASWPICHGEKGIMRFEIMIPHKNSNIVSWEGGTVRNVVAAHSELLLDVPFSEAAPRFEGMERIETKEEEGKIRIIATGAPVHASMPDDGINAIGLIANAVLESGLANEGAKKALEFVKLATSDFNGRALGVPFADEPSGKLTHVPGVIKTLDGEMALSIDIRYPVTCDGDAVFSTIQKTLEPYGVGYSDFVDSKPIYIPADSDFVKLVMNTIEGVFHREDWEPYTMGGGTYARNLTNAYAIGPEDDQTPSPFGPYRGGVHQNDECASVSLLLNAMKTYARLLVNLDDLEF